MKKKILFLFLLILLVGCKNSHQIVLDFDVDVENYKPFEESGYQLSYQIIPLEKTDSLPIFFINKVMMNDKYIYVLSITDNRTFNITLFDRKGNYIKKIKNGNAEDELTAPTDFKIDDLNLMILDHQNKIKIYDLAGNYISTTNLDTPTLEFGKIGNKYVLYDGNYSDLSTNFSIWDGNQITHYSEKRGSRDTIISLPTRQISQYNNDLYFIAQFDNIVYKLGEKEEKPVEYALFKNAFSDTTIKDRSELALKNMTDKKKFTAIRQFTIINNDLVFIETTNGHTHINKFIYDKSFGTAYQPPLDVPVLMMNLGSYKGKTIHSFKPTIFDMISKSDFRSQDRGLYAKIEERYKKYGPNENPYLILVSYNKKNN